MIRAVVTDIEGTTTPIAFVRDVLFPYARTRLPAFLAETGGSAETAALVEETRRLSGGQEPLEALLAWMDEDAKAGPLKAIQGLIWDEGYANGGLVGALYPDVAPNLKRLRAAGLRLFVYSSGSLQAQRLLFGHSVAGDLAGSFDGFFDTAVGGKREASSYRRLADAAGFACEEMLFLSDVAEELAAASAAGMATLQIVRTGDRTVPAPGFAQAASFDGVLAEEAPPEP